MLFDLIALGLAVTQLAYQTITNGVPNLVNSLFNKAAEFNIMKTDNSESGK
jgi:hypothetical protein